jgi:hypothetical protein
MGVLLHLPLSERDKCIALKRIYDNYPVSAIHHERNSALGP